jgi:hypothetical protein
MGDHIRKFLNEVQASPLRRAALQIWLANGYMLPSAPRRLAPHRVASPRIASSSQFPSESGMAKPNPTETLNPGVNYAPSDPDL